MRLLRPHPPSHSEIFNYLFAIKFFTLVHYYLSSYKLGNARKVLKRLCPYGKIAYIPNALDFTGADPDRRKSHIQEDIKDLTRLDLVTEVLDLRQYFDKPRKELQEKILDVGAIFISGGNVFVLRQAMYLSKLDQLLQNLKHPEFLYAGYSAGACVLSPTLRSYSIVDDSNDRPYDSIATTIWTGLDLIPYQFLPHYDSDHPESADMDLEIAYCKNNRLIYRAVRDGEVLVIEDSTSREDSQFKSLSPEN